jgi:hypothetical protein
MKLLLNLCPGLSEPIAKPSSRFVQLSRKLRYVTLHVLVAAIRRVCHLYLFNVEHADGLVTTFGSIAVRSVGSEDFELRFVSGIKAK